VKSIKKGFVRARNAAGIEDFQFRDTRRTFSSRLNEQGVDPLIIQRLLRHSSFKISEQVHIQSNLKMMKEAMEKLNQNHTKDPKKGNFVPACPHRYMKNESKRDTLPLLFSMN